MDKKPLPVGIDDFEKLITGNYYYVDKTDLIMDLFDMKGEVNVFTRPRRFGKTLNMSMLRCFFENTGDEKRNEKNRKLFDGMNISKRGTKYGEQMTNYPVISLSLKSGKQPEFDLAMVSLKRQIANEFRRHEDMISGLGDLEVRYRRIMSEEAGTEDYMDALAFLSQCLSKVYRRKCIILIDEYDVPLENAYFEGFYNQMISFIRSLFESALKSNPYLEFAVITGCLRVTKESIFTGLNNLKIISILNAGYDEYFGFTQREVDEMLKYYERESSGNNITSWYNGYRFGNTEVYNPWSVIKYVKALYVDSEAFPSPYWANTSSNSIVRNLVERASLSVRSDIENLIDGGTIEKVVHEDITYEDIEQSDDNLWNFLFFTGYLSMKSSRMEGENLCVTMAIPNIEVRYIYNHTIMNWFRDEIKSKDLSGLFQAIVEGEAEQVQMYLSKLLMDSISFMDSKEAFYHGFILGILGNMKDFLVKSNRESGQGRYDILVRSLDVTIPVAIFELKVSDTFKGMEKACDRALGQIADKGYDTWLPEEGYTQVIYYGIAFFKKQCRVKACRKQL